MFLFIKKSLLFLLCLSMFFSPLLAKENGKERMLADLDHIREIFSVKYAPLQWKGEYKNWDLDEEMAHAKKKLHLLAKPTVKEFQRIVKSFYDSTADYHVGVKFYSTESASLPIIIKGA